MDENPAIGFYRGYIGIMENKMETTIVYWGYIGTMEKKMKLLYYNRVYVGSVQRLRLRFRGRAPCLLADTSLHLMSRMMFWQRPAV